MKTQALTRNQSLVFGALDHAKSPMTAYEILDALRDDGFRAPLQVYRALDKLVELGVVHRLESLNSFVACAHPEEQCSNHGLTAFAICETCGGVVEFHHHGVEDQLKAFLADKGFMPEKTVIEIRGRCKGCAGSA